METEWTTAGLWLAVVASGLFHGVSPGMGWPLAVSAGMMGRGRRDLLAALVPLAVGHLAAMSVALLPFALLAGVLEHESEIRAAASIAVLCFGLYLLVVRRHPRAIARIRPTQLALWSFVIALAHGAGLMLAPIYLGLCAAGAQGAGHEAAQALMSRSLGTAALVALVHTAATIAAGGTMALIVQEWLGLKALRSAWFNLDRVWAASLVLVGGAGLATL